MLQGLRNAGRSWLGKAIITVMFCFLILSFAIWGIGDIFRGYGIHTVARVGSAEISTDALRNAYQNEIQRLSRQYRQPITPDQARANGVDAQVFGRLVAEAALDQRAKALGLGLSNKAVAQSIVEEPMFRGASGQFDRAMFNDALRSNGLNEANFVRDQRALMVRQQLAEAVAGGVAVPLALRDALHRYNAERRTIGYFVLPAASAGDIPTPDEATLKTFYDDRKASFRAPEYRRLAILTLTPEALADAQVVSDAEARARYEDSKASRFGSPERRRIDQILFPSEAEAKAAAERIRAGTSFDEIAKERNIAPKDLLLGIVARADLFDQAVRDAAFALPEGGVSGPVAGRFGIVLVRVGGIDPEHIRPYDEVAAEVRRDVALEKARRAVNDIHDKIEDQRAAAKPLIEIAPPLSLSVRTIEAIDRAGADKAGKPVDGLPERDALLTAAFASDIGADNETLRSRDNGYVWFEITSIEPSRDRPLDEVRAEAERQWRSDEVAKRLADKARTYVAELDKGTPLVDVAAAAGEPARTAEGLTRGMAQGELSAAAVAQIFSIAAGKAGSVAFGDGDSRAVFKVEAATLAPMPAASPEATQLDQQIKLALNNDLITEYVNKLQTDLGVTVNQQALRAVLGGGEN